MRRFFEEPPRPDGHPSAGGEYTMSVSLFISKGISSRTRNYYARTVIINYSGELKLPFANI